VGGTGTHAVVVGAGIAGLLTARVLSDHFDEVTVLERDQLDDCAADRRGATQGRHAHALLSRGQQTLEALFPGLTEELRQAGARTGDFLADSRLYFSGHRLCPAPSGLIAVSCTRALLEHRVRYRVLGTTNVRIHDRCAVAGLTTDTRGSTVTGVRLRDERDERPQTMDADIVVDTTGRNSRAPTWLERLDYPSPPVDQVHVDVAYATRRYRMDSDALSGDLAIINAPTPTEPRAGALALLEGGVGMLTLAGVCGDRPPLDPDGFAAFAHSLAFPDIGEAIRAADPIDDPVPHRFAASSWRRYDRLDRLPGGFVVLGDGVCSFNPIYGQGMTIASLEAAALGEHLHRHGRLRTHRLEREVARIARPAWEMAAGSDLQFREVRGHRRKVHRLAASYMRRLHAVGADDAELSRAFVRVSGLVDSPAALLRPRVAVRVLRRRPRPAPGSPTVLS
jgi:2-polyprenyl-6-methoxyphenol hydroxylase-like FAD-dependent oxidoreductase